MENVLVYHAVVLRKDTLSEGQLSLPPTVFLSFLLHA